MAEAARPFSEEELLDLARGGAEPGLAARAAEAVARDAGLRAELAAMRALGPALGGAEAGPPPGDFGWKRLEAALRAEGPRAAPRSGRASAWRAAAAVLALVAVGQGAYIAVRPGEEADGVYRTAAGETLGHVLGVAFGPEARAGEIEALLRAAGARIVDGPGATGLYRLAFASAAAREAGRARLAASGLVALLADE